MADSAFLRAIDSHFDLDNAQKKRVESDIDALFAWHRQNELPKYAETFRNAVNDAQDGISVDEVDRYWKFADQAYVTIAKQLAPPAAAFLSTVSNAQIGHMEKESETRLKKRLGREKDAKTLERSTEKNLKTWVGSLSESQMSTVREYAKRALPIQRAMLDRNAERQRTFAALLRSHPGQTELSRQVELRLVDPKVAGEIPYAELREQSQEATRFLVRTLMPSLNEKQLKHFQNELRSWAGDMETLSR